jgi:hypothetical protein
MTYLFTAWKRGASLLASCYYCLDWAKEMVDLSNPHDGYDASISSMDFSFCEVPFCTN